MQKLAAIYVRISRDKIGAGLGVDRQRAECEQLAERLGWTVVQVYSDNDLSAYSGKPRPGYRAMLAAIQAGRVDAVLAWHTDRLHRSPVELEEYISVCEPRSVPTHCVKAGILDLTTASGRMTARITGAVARGESEHMSERILAQKARAAAAGQWTGGGRPFGYSRNGMELVPAEADVVRDGVRRILAGESVYSITKQWRAEVPTAKGGEWRGANVTRMLTRPRNAGLAVHQGKVIGKGAWPPIITEDEYQAVCAILNDPKRTTYSGVRSLKWLGSGLYRCGRCGGDMRPGTAISRGVSRHIYRCRLAAHMKINAKPIDDLVLKVTCSLLDKHGANLLPTTTTDNREAMTALQAEANALRRRYLELDDMFSDGEIDRAGRARQRERIDARLAELSAQLDHHVVSALDGIADADSPSAAFLDQLVARQRAIVDTLMTITINPSRPGRPPKGVTFDYDRVSIEPRNLA